jgi:hypothetical protein
MVPWERGTNFKIAFKRVDFPAPLGPIRVVSCPRLRVRVMEERMGFPSKDTWAFSKERRGREDFLGEGEEESAIKFCL